MGNEEANKIKGILKENNINFKIFVHKPVFTSQEAANERGLELRL